MNDSNSCDCFIGFISGERVFKSTIHIEASSISQIQPVFKQYGLMKGGKAPIREMDLICDSHFESRLTYERALKLVKIINGEQK